MATIYIQKDKSELPKRAKNDVYKTEHNLIRAAYDMFLPRHDPHSILDVGAGDGRWGTIAKEYAVEKFPAYELGNKIIPSLHGVEIRNLPIPDGYDYWYVGDFLTWESNTMYELIVSNPPYFIAEEIIRKSWDFLALGGGMLMLLPLSFMATIKRYKGLWGSIYPHTVAVCSRRPSFYGGGTNGTDYGIYAWLKLLNGMPLGNPRSWNVQLLMYERDKNAK